MNRENAKALLPLLTAYAEGKTIEFEICPGTWMVMDDPEFDGNPRHYRIKTDKTKRLRTVADGLRRIQESESARYLEEYADLLADASQPEGSK